MKKTLIILALSAAVIAVYVIAVNYYTSLKGVTDPLAMKLAAPINWFKRLFVKVPSTQFIAAAGPAKDGQSAWIPANGFFS